MALRKLNIEGYCDNREEAVSFVSETLQNLLQESTNTISASITITEREQSGDYFASIAIL